MLSSPPNSPRFAKIGVFDPKTGRYIRSPKKTVYGTKADARRALKEYRVELECGVKNPEELTVGNYARAWYERRKNTGRYSPLTLKDDELQVRKIEDIWGATLLEDLTLKKISDAYDKLLASKKATKSAIHKIRDPKSEKSHRWLGLDDGTIAFFAEWKQKQARAMEVAGLEQDEKTPVCTNRRQHAGGNRQARRPRSTKRRFAALRAMRRPGGAKGASGTAAARGAARNLLRAPISDAGAVSPESPTHRDRLLLCLLRHEGKVLLACQQLLAVAPSCRPFGLLTRRAAFFGLKVVRLFARRPQWFSPAIDH